MDEYNLKLKIRTGVRPSLDQLPPETTWILKDMISSCWDADRRRRKSAAECLSILQELYSAVTSTRVDVLLNRNAFQQDTMDQIYYHLLGKGLSVVYQPQNSQTESKNNYLVTINQFSNHNDTLENQRDNPNQLFAQFQSARGMTQNNTFGLNLDMAVLSHDVEQFEKKREKEEELEPAARYFLPNYRKKLTEGLRPLVERVVLERVAAPNVQI
jgi:hypothetical protein